MMLSAWVEDVVARVRARIERGERVSLEDLLEEAPEVPRGRLLELIEDALMRADELKSEGVGISPGLSIHLSTLKALVEEAEDYGEVRREAAAACFLALAILDSAGEVGADRLEPYLDELRAGVSRIAEKVFS